MAEEVGTDGGTLDEAKKRIAETGSPTPSDMRFALLDETDYAAVVEPRTGPANIKAQGVIDVQNDEGRFKDFGKVIGFQRAWVSASDTFRLNEEVALLTSTELAQKYAERLRNELAPLNLPEVEATAPNVEYVFEFGVQSLEPARRCISVAVARRDRVVSLATFSHACTVISGPWAAQLASFSLEQAQAKLGL